MPKWTSPELTPVACASSAAENEYYDAPESSSAVLTPFAGWYGLCFGTKEISSLSNGSSFDATDDDENGLGVVDDDGSFVARIALLNDHDETQERLDLPLPLRRPNTSVDAGKPLTCCLFGELIYLLQGTRVSVTTTQHCRTDNPVTTTAAAQKSQTNTFSSHSVHHWRLVWHKSALTSSSSSSCHHDDASSPSPPGLGSRPNNNKTLICATCYRLFPSLRAVTCHIVTMHKTTEHSTTTKNTLWTTPLHVLYQDDTLAVIDKPQGMPVMGGNRGQHHQQTLCRSDLLLPLSNYNKNIANTENHNNNSNNNNSNNNSNNLRKPVPVHRLDAATGGLLVVAKTKWADRALKRSFAERGACFKRYRALVFGRLLPQARMMRTMSEEEEGHEESSQSSQKYFQEQKQQQDKAGSSSCGGGSLLLCDAPIGGKSAVTFYKVIQYCRSVDPMAREDQWITVVDLFPTTGRRHQLRRHLKQVGHAIWGDKRYARYPKVEKKSNNDDDNNNLVHHDDDDDDVLDDDDDIQKSVERNPHARLCLWAMELTFPHPNKSQAPITVRADEPQWLTALIRHEEAKWRRASLLQK